jgi:hypothetical protein
MFADRLGAALRPATRPRGLSLALATALLAVAGVHTLPPAGVHAAQSTGPQADFSIADIYSCDPHAPASVCDRNVQGIAPVLDLIFPGPGDYQLASSGSYLQLDFEHSAVLLPDLSTLTVLLNGAPIPAASGSSDSSIRLDASNKTDTSIKLLVPTSMVQPGFNDVQLRFYQRFREPCDDVNNPALISTVHASSKLHYAYLPGNPLRTNRDPLNLKQFPYPFFRAGWTRSGETLVVLPANPNPDELSAAGTLALAFGVDAGSQPISFATTTADQLTADMETGNDLIAIGTPQRNPLIAQITRNTSYTLTPDGTAFALETGGPTLDPSTGVDAIAASPVDATRVALAVTGGSNEALLRAALALSDSRSRALLDGDSTAVTQPSDISSFRENPTAAPPFARTFAQLGLKDQTFSGGIPGVTVPADSSTGVANVAFDGPPAPGSGSVTLQLVISHPDAQSLDYSRSQVKVVLNGVSVGGAKLDDSTLNRGMLTLKLNATDVKPGYNQMQIVFTLMPQGAAQTSAAATTCTPDTGRAWVTLWADSNIDIPGGGTPPQPPDLSVFPFPNLYTSSMAGSYVVVGDDPAGWQQALTLLADVGRRTEGGAGLVNVLRTGDLNPAIEQRGNLLLVGQPSQLASLYRRIDSALPVQFTLDQAGNVTDKLAQNSPQVLIATRDQAQIGVDETVASPFNGARTLTVVTGTNGDSVGLARLALTKPEPSSNVLIVSSAYQPPTALTLAAQQNVIALKPKTKSSLQTALLPLLTALFALGAVGLAGYWVMTAARRAREGE